MIEHLRGRDRKLEPLGWTTGGMSDPLMFYRALWGAARQDPQGALRGPTG